MDNNRLVDKVVNLYFEGYGVTEALKIIEKELKIPEKGSDNKCYNY